MKWLNPTEVSEIINKPQAFVAGIANAGLLGKIQDGKISRKAVDEWSKYGCQWTKFRDVKPFADASGMDELTISSHMQARYWNAALEPDEVQGGWLGLAFFKLNSNYFAHHSNQGFIGGSGIRLSGSVLMPMENATVVLFPDPDGELATIMIVQDMKQELYSDVRVAFDSIFSQVNSEIAFNHDRYFRPIQSIIVGLPSGNLHFDAFYFPRKSQWKGITIPKAWPTGLFEAKRLYGDALSNPDIFIKFLLMYKSFELSTKMRGEIRKQLTGRTADRRCDVLEAEEIFPSRFGFDPYEGKPFSAIANRLRDSYRNAIAHVNTEPSMMLRSNSLEDRDKVWHILPFIVFMARIRLLNCEKTLRLGKPIARAD